MEHNGTEPNSISVHASMLSPSTRKPIFVCKMHENAPLLDSKTHTQPFTAVWILFGTTRVSRYQKKHSPNPKTRIRKNAKRRPEKKHAFFTQRHSKFQAMGTTVCDVFRFVQRCYCILGLLQLTFMISFSRCYLPTTCSLVQLFNITSSLPGCPSGPSNPGRNGSDFDPGGVGESAERPTWLWLVWPILLCVGTVCEFLVDIFWISVARFSTP